MTTKVKLKNKAFMSHKVGGNDSDFLMIQRCDTHLQTKKINGRSAEFTGRIHNFKV
jgi:hypothetical protein